MLSDGSTAAQADAAVTSTYMKLAMLTPSENLNPTKVVTFNQTTKKLEVSDFPKQKPIYIVDDSGKPVEGNGSESDPFVLPPVVTTPVTTSLIPSTVKYVEVEVGGQTQLQAQYLPAQADVPENTAHVMMLSDDTFINSGKVIWPNHGLDTKVWYFLSQNVAGGFISPGPDDGIIQKLFFVEDENTIHVNVIGAVASSGSTDETFFADGAIPDATVVVITQDGKVQTPSLSVPGIKFSTKATFNDGAVSDTSVVYSPQTGKVVVAYSDVSNSNHGTVVTGTVTDMGITFGTKVVFNSAGTKDISTAYDPVSNNVLIAFVDEGNNNHGSAIIAQLSDTSVSFGTKVVFNAGATAFTKIAYDSNADKMVVAYSDGSNSNFGTASVGTITGNTISFGTKSVFLNAQPASLNTGFAAVFDNITNMVVIAYRDPTTGFGNAVIGTVATNTIAFNTPVAFSSISTEGISGAYHPPSSKTVIAYRDATNSKGLAVLGSIASGVISFTTPVQFSGNDVKNTSSLVDYSSGKVVIAFTGANSSEHGSVIIGTVNNSVITFGDKMIFNSSNTDNIVTTYVSNSARIVAVYKDTDSSNFGGANILFDDPGFSNIDNWLGITKTSAEDGALVAVTLDGETASNLTGLIPGSHYYLTETGGLTTNANSRYIGRALAANKLRIIGSGVKIIPSFF
jgi:hypothetical protein